MTVDRSIRPHYVSHNKVTRLPRSFIYLDTEALQRAHRGSQIQSFRLAVTALDRRRHDAGSWYPRQWAEHRSVSALWDWIDGHAQRKARTVLVAHNVAYDLRIADAFRELPRRGWEVEDIRLGDNYAWASWRNGERSLIASDTMSWLNMALDRVGALTGMPKLDLPAWEDDDDTWLARCRRDVEIMADAYRRVIDWLRDADLGNWKPTGAGQAWAAYRHRHMTFPILVHDNQDARDAERRAGWTGRCEAWRWGKLTGGPFTEWDYTTQYARIGAECGVPTQLVAEIRGPSLLKLDAMAGKHAVLSECDVTTDVPVVPTRVDGRIVWPVGSFRSTLWENEVAFARERGASITPTRAWWYVRRPALQSFCRWCLDVLELPDRDVDPVVRAVVKHWSRALIGRFAARWSSWDEVGRSPWEDVALGWLRDVGADDLSRYLQLGHRIFRQSAEYDSQDSAPGVMTWVMAEARCRLWAAAETAGLGSVAYMDTDSLIVDRTGHQALARAALPGFRVKGRWQTVEVLGPRQIVLQGALRAAGVPRSAVRVEPDTWESDIWTGIAQSLAKGEPDVVRINRRRVRLRGVDHRREHVLGGSTRPFTLNTLDASVAI